MAWSKEMDIGAHVIQVTKAGFYRFESNIENCSPAKVVRWIDEDGEEQFSVTPIRQEQMPIAVEVGDEFCMVVRTFKFTPLSGWYMTATYLPYSRWTRIKRWVRWHLRRM